MIAVSDSRGGVMNKDGIDPDAVIRHKRETGSVLDFPGSKPISNEDLLELEVDVLYPSALEGVITAKNANNIKAKISCELANGPTTPEADKILFEKGVYVLPDFLANAGGVTVSYFEQVQNTYNYYWSLEDVHAQLDRKMTDAFLSVYEMQQKAAGILAQKRAEAQGIEEMKKALEGEGGRNMVKLEYAKKLQGVRITGQPFTIQAHTERFEHLNAPASSAKARKSR